MAVCWFAHMLLPFHLSLRYQHVYAQPFLCGAAQHTGALYTVYSRCSRPWIVWHRWHANMLTENIWEKKKKSQPSNGSWHEEWARRAPCCERLFMSSWVNYTQGPNIRHHVPTREQKEDLQEPSQAFMKASTVSRWPCLPLPGEQKPLKSHWASWVRALVELPR